MKQALHRKLSAFLRLGLAALLFLGNIALVVVLVALLETKGFWIYAALQAASVLTAGWVLSRRDSPAYKMGWVFLLLAAPVTGLLLFLFWGGHIAPKRQTLAEKPDIVPKDYELSRSEKYAARLSEGCHWGRLAGYLRKRGALLFKNTEAVYFSSGEALFEDILFHLERAERFIFMEYFILAEGRLWDRFAAILKQKAREGVEVKIIFDDFGSIARLSSRTVESLRSSGAEVAVFNPVHRHVSRLFFNYRDHRKILVIDGQRAYTGGANLGDEYVDLVKRFGHWKDTGVALDGDGAWGLTTAFLHMWEEMGQEIRQEHDYYRPHEMKNSDGWCQIFLDGPDRNPDTPAAEVFLHAINGAKRSLCITTPYLSLEDSMLRALCTAADGGVEVRLILPGIPDHKFTHIAAGWYFEELLRHGVRIYLYTPGFLHAKMLAADGELAMVGTVNMDYRSFYLHYECGVLLYKMPAVAAVERDMGEILAESREITLKKWLKRGRLRRGLETLLNLFSIWM